MPNVNASVGPISEAELVFRMIALKAQLALRHVNVLNLNL